MNMHTHLTMQVLFLTSRILRVMMA